MKDHRFWIEIVIVVTVLACALALLIATLGVAGGVAIAALGQQKAPVTDLQSYEGMVTCSRCGARHSAAIGKNASDCARICIHTGAQFSLVDGDKTYLLDGDPTDLKRVAGRRARIAGAISGKTIKVASVSTEP
jgi:hypothetical protein